MNVIKNIVLNLTCDCLIFLKKREEGAYKMFLYIPKEFVFVSLIEASAVVS